MTYSISIRVLCSLFTLLAVSDSARILAYFPTPSISHQVVFRSVTLELSKRGHDVVVITTDPVFAKEKAPVNYTEIDVHDISYELWKKFVDASTGKADDINVQIRTAFKQMHSIFVEQLKVNAVKRLLNDKNQKFDLLIIEAVARLTLSFSHILKIPTIQFSSFGGLPGMYETVGAPTHYLLYPLPIRQRINNLTIWDKVSEYRTHDLLYKTFDEMEELENQLLKKIFGSQFPTIAELRDNVDLMFLNTYPIWDFNRPVPPNVIYLGGVHQNSLKVLPQDLKSYLDSSTNGVIYMSLGTNVKPSTLPQETVRIFLKVFSTLPYNVLWKWDQDELDGRPNNVNISKWFPQSDLLHHPNVKLFITQGGLQSTDESITAGVPLVGIPMLGDQWYNVELYVRHKIGVKLDMETITEEDLTNAIKTILKDNSYRKNIVKLRNLVRDQPQTPLERAIWWTEYVLRHRGAKHLRSPAANISWTEYLELRLIFIVLFVTLGLVITTFFAIKLLIRSLLLPNSKLKDN